MAADSESSLADYHWYHLTEKAAIHLVFSYGSNMGRGQIATRCPQSKFVDRAVLRGYRWHINSRGYANVLNSESDEVQGLVHALSDSDLSTLDKNEGVHRKIYERLQVSVVLDTHRSIALGRIRFDSGRGTPKQDGAHVDGEEHERVLRCWVYQDRKNIADAAPVEEYVNRINTGIRDAALSVDYVQHNIRRQLPERAPPLPLPHKIYLFVYGTLKRGGSNHHWMARNHARFESTAVLRHAELYHVYTYPGAVQATGSGSVVLGELYSCASYDAVDDLDRLEGYKPETETRSLYLRRPTWVETPDGRGVQATVYWYNRPTTDLKLLPNGFFPVAKEAMLRSELTEEEATTALVGQGIGAEYIQRLLGQAEGDVATALCLWDAALADGHLDLYLTTSSHHSEEHPAV